ncbi:MAG TPA: amidohydrolase family protein [Steroidobacteraceae bacterium]|nr:amidohydrolase family protein [Steroidobacteraceae bacterium]
MAIIDVHTHAYTREYLAQLRTRGAPYSLKVRPDGKEEIFRGETPVAFPQPGHFDYDLRIRDMDENHIDVSIVSLTCPNCYWGGEQTSLDVARQSNDSMAAARKRHPGRILWYASLPWQYPKQAVEELKRTVDNGASGVMVLANIEGRSLTDPFLSPIWQAIDDRKLAVLVHPTQPPGAQLMDMDKYDLAWAVGFMTDTTLCFARMIFDGFLDLYPNLKLIASHGGGTLPYLVGRFDKGDEVELPSRRRIKERPSVYLRRLWYDGICYSPEALSYLIRIVGADRVLYGTDYPHQVHDAIGMFAKTEAMPADQRQAIREGNARRLFN